MFLWLCLLIIVSFFSLVYLSLLGLRPITQFRPKVRPIFRPFLQAQSPGQRLPNAWPNSRQSAWPPARPWSPCMAHPSTLGFWSSVTHVPNTREDPRSNPLLHGSIRLAFSLSHTWPTAWSLWTQLNCMATSSHAPANHLLSSERLRPADQSLDFTPMNVQLVTRHPTVQSEPSG